MLKGGTSPLWLPWQQWLCDADSGSEHSEEQEEESDTASADHNSTNSLKRPQSSQTEANTTGQSLQGTTVLLSCYGVGYSNVYRKVT